MNFSHRTSWHRQPNPLSGLLEQRRRSGLPIYDLTTSNPTECGIEYPQREILSALAKSQALHYQPDPRGLLSAREAVASYYSQLKIATDPLHIFLAASTSEAYSLLFKLLCNAGDAVAIPVPSYPLFEYLAQANDVKLAHYRLRYDDEWHIDIESLKQCMNESLRAIVIVNPHNPTGMFLKRSEYEQISEIARQHSVALIVDEVFIDYPFNDDIRRCSSTAGASDVLTFTLNGISKSIGLPQMKLGWIVVSGDRSLVSEATARLEILCDTFLSVNTPVQVALPELLAHGEAIRSQILLRTKSNYAFLQRLADDKSPITSLQTEGGWYAILRVPQTKSDEAWALELIEKAGVYVFPGYFFDFAEEGRLVVSLLPERRLFQAGTREAIAYVTTAA